MLQKGEPVTDKFAEAFSGRVGELVAEDKNFIWIRDIRPGLLEYVAARVAEFEADANVQSIRLCIASPGGDLDETLGIYSILSAVEKPTVAHVFWAYSGGVIVALACDVRIGYPATTILIHDPWMSVEGRSDYIADHIMGIDLKRKVIRDILLTRTRLTARKLNAVQRKEWWLDVDKALQLGILTHLRGSEEDTNGTDVVPDA